MQFKGTDPLRSQLAFGVVQTKISPSCGFLTRPNGVVLSRQVAQKRLGWGRIACACK